MKTAAGAIGGTLPPATTTTIIANGAIALRLRDIGLPDPRPTHAVATVAPRPGNLKSPNIRAIARILGGVEEPYISDIWDFPLSFSL
ncbi:hypothetical protein NMY22_g10787 [Coprinellus aureogranulatus]|nr:hypothetical protein NMY22_g10787 [Coprinellus aureogranulatus]